MSSKTLPTWAWLLIGCGTILLLLGIASGVAMWWGFGKARDLAADFEANPGLAAARLVVAANPDMEEIAVDEEAGTITVRNTRTDEEITVDFEAARDGKLSFTSGDRRVSIEAQEPRAGDEGGSGGLKITTDEGELTLAGGDSARGDRPAWVPLYPGAEIVNQHALRHDSGIGGGAELATTSGVAEVAEFYRRRFAAEGLVISEATFAGDGGDSVMLTGTDEGAGRKLVTTIRRGDDRTLVNLTFNDTERQ